MCTVHKFNSYPRASHSATTCADAQGVSGSLKLKRLEQCRQQWSWRVVIAPPHQSYSSVAHVPQPLDPSWSPDPRFLMAPKPLVSSSSPYPRFLKVPRPSVPHYLQPLCSSSSPPLLFLMVPKPSVPHGPPWTPQPLSSSSCSADQFLTVHG